MYSKIGIMQSTMYENKDFLLIRKPHGIPSTFGKEKSFLDILKKNVSEHTITWTPLSELLPAELFPFASSRLQGFTELKKNDQNSKNINNTTMWQCYIEAILRKQIDTFGQEKEYGLLNRLDNETAGFLYFAKSQKAFDHFKSLQKSGHIKKFYLAQIVGNKDSQMSDVSSQTSDVSSQMPVVRPVWNLKSDIWSLKSDIWRINTPIMHSKFHPEKMIAIHSPRDIRSWRGKEHHVSTQIDILQYDKKNNITTILATITKGIRHQIRVHLASQGTPILGDNLYGIATGNLHLWSIWFRQE